MMTTTTTTRITKTTTFATTTTLPQRDNIDDDDDEGDGGMLVGTTIADDGKYGYERRKGDERRMSAPVYRRAKRLSVQLGSFITSLG